MLFIQFQVSEMNIKAKKLAQSTLISTKTQVAVIWDKCMLHFVLNGQNTTPNEARRDQNTTD